MKGRTQQQAAVRANLRGRHTVAKYSGSAAAERVEATAELPDPVRPVRGGLAGGGGDAGAGRRVGGPRRCSTGSVSGGGRLPRRAGADAAAAVALWRVEHTSPLLTLERSPAGARCCRPTGSTWTTGVTGRGRAVPHLLIHSVLPYSNLGVAGWRSRSRWSRCAWRSGARWLRLGHVPRVHQTTGPRGDPRLVGTGDRGRTVADRGFNPEYLAIAGALRTGAADDPPRESERERRTWKPATGDPARPRPAPLAAREPRLPRVRGVRALRGPASSRSGTPGAGRGWPRLAAIGR